VVTEPGCDLGGAGGVSLIRLAAVYGTTTTMMMIIIMTSFLRAR